MPIFFADDSNSFLNGKNIDEIQSTLNSELDEIVELTLNMNKSQCMVFIRRRYTRNVTIRNQNIEQVCKVKCFLGLGVT